MTNDRSFLKHALVYGMANLLTQAANFLLIPLFTRCLDKDRFGDLETVGRAAELAGLFLLVSGLRQGLMTLYQQKDSDRERRRTVGAVLAIVCCGTVLVGGAMCVWAATVGGWLGVEGRLFLLAVLAIVLEPFHLLPLSLMQARLESTRFVTITISHFFLRFLLSFVFVAWFDWGVAGVLGATALSGAVFATLLVGRELWHGAAWPDWRRIRGLLRFALPFLPASVCFFILQNGDRFFLKWLHGSAEVATYSIGYKLAQAVGTFSLVPLYMVWSSHLYTAARAADAPVVFGRAFTRILAAFLFIGLGLSLFEVEAVKLLGGTSYLAAVPVVAPVILAGFFQSAAALMDAAFYIHHQTKQKLAITLAATVLIVILYALWIPAYGSMGAALATLAGFAFLAVATWWVTQRIFPVVYEWRRLGTILALATAFWLASRPLPATFWWVPVKAAVWLAWPAALWLLGLISEDEQRQVMEFVRRPLGDEPVEASELAETTELVEAAA